ncbi:DUF6913 domain-containing protein [Corallibacter sp.]|uniref:DUF6913 domain-containing protein n=1 Tax=Corallibacter sp. TaxID=2038084 RepID=UPI003A8C8BD1
MILKGFKEKSIKKQLSSILKNRQLKFSDKKIESVGIILSADEVNDFESLKTLSTRLNVLPNKLKIIAYTSSKKEMTYSWDVCFNPNDFTWNGRVKNAELQTFINTEFDLLISYYSTDVTTLKYITAASKSVFKTSIFQKDKRLNDLIINTDLQNVEAFKNELYKYLTVLNKIKE